MGIVLSKREVRRSFRGLGTATKREVLTLAGHGQRHPDPAVAATAFRWAKAEIALQPARFAARAVVLVIVVIGLLVVPVGSLYLRGGFAFALTLAGLGVLNNRRLAQRVLSAGDPSQRG